MRERLIELRKILKLSQRAFADKLNLPQTTYAPFETHRVIRDSYVKLICDTYNVNELWLREGQGEVFSEPPNRELEELLNIYDDLQPTLKKYLLRHATELKDLQDELKP